MKKSIWVICLLILLLTCTALADGAAQQRMVVVNPKPGDRLNLRAAASSDSASLGKFYTGTVVTLEREAAGGWAAVCVGGLHSYMDAAYLEPYPYFNGKLQTYQEQLPVVTLSQGLEGHALPSEDSSVVLTLGAGNRMRLLGITPDGWALVQPTEVDEPVWVAGGSLDPQPSFFTTDLSPVSSTGNLRIIVNPDRTDRLNLRQEPSGKSASFGKYYTGAVVRVDTEIQLDGWSYVGINTEYGYMDNDFLVPYTSDNLERYTASLPKCTVANANGKGANFRSDPSSGQNIVQLIPNGKTVTVMGITANGFAYIQYGDTVGYVQGNLLSPAITFQKQSSSR